MTDLQMGLIGLGGAAVFGVLAYNKWQEHKHRKLAEQLLNGRQADVLLDDATASNAPGELAGKASGAIAGAPSQPTATDVPPTPSSQDRVEPLLRNETAADQALAAESDADRPESRAVSAPLCHLSPMIDYIAAVEVSEPLSPEQVREARSGTLARLGKPVNWIGYNESAHAWEPIVEDSDRTYQHIRVGLQLVDRQGPVRDGDLSIFQVAMQELATGLMGLVELPAREPALKAAAQLDEFCAGVDIQIGVNVISQGQVFPGTKLRALAESAGMVIDAEGRFARCDDDGSLLYVLLNQETQGFSAESMRTMSTHGVTFLLDIPRVAGGDRVLTQMIEVARRFADALHGALVDDNRRPLPDNAIEPIRRQVVQYQASMATRQLPAGGALAQRLFS